MKSFKKGIALIAVLAFLITAILPVSGLAAEPESPAWGSNDAPWWYMNSGTRTYTLGTLPRPASALPYILPIWNNGSLETSNNPFISSSGREIDARATAAPMPNPGTNSSVNNVVGIMHAEFNWEGYADVSHDGYGAEEGAQVEWAWDTEDPGLNTPNSGVNLNTWWGKANKVSATKSGKYPAAMYKACVSTTTPAAPTAFSKVNDKWSYTWQAWATGQQSGYVEGGCSLGSSTDPAPSVTDALAWEYPMSAVYSNLVLNPTITSNWVAGETYYIVARVQNTEGRYTCIKYTVMPSAPTASVSQGTQKEYYAGTTITPTPPYGNRWEANNTATFVAGGRPPMNNNIMHLELREEDIDSVSDIQWAWLTSNVVGTAYDTWWRNASTASGKSGGLIRTGVNSGEYSQYSQDWENWGQDEWSKQWTTWTSSNQATSPTGSLAWIWPSSKYYSNLILTPEITKDWPVSNNSKVYVGVHYTKKAGANTVESTNVYEVTIKEPSITPTASPTSSTTVAVGSTVKLIAAVATPSLSAGNIPMEPTPTATPPASPSPAIEQDAEYKNTSVKWQYRIGNAGAFTGITSGITTTDPDDLDAGNAAVNDDTLTFKIPSEAAGSKQVQFQCALANSNGVLFTDWQDVATYTTGPAVAEIQAMASPQPAVVPLGYGAAVSATITSAPSGATYEWNQATVSGTPEAITGRTPLETNQAVRPSGNVNGTASPNPNAQSTVFPATAGPNYYSLTVSNPSASSDAERAISDKWVTVNAVELAAMPLGTPGPNEALAPTEEAQATSVIANTPIELDVAWAKPAPSSTSGLVAADAPSTVPPISWTSDPTNAYTQNQTTGGMSNTITIANTVNVPVSVSVTYPAASNLPSGASTPSPVRFSITPVTLTSAQPTSATIPQYTGQAQLGVQWSSTDPVNADKVEVRWTAADGKVTPETQTAKSDGTFDPVTFSSNSASPEGKPFTVTATAYLKDTETLVGGSAVTFNVTVTPTDAKPVIIDPVKSDVRIGQTSDPFTAQQPKESGSSEMVTVPGGTWSVTSSTGSNVTSLFGLVNDETGVTTVTVKDGSGVTPGVYTLTYTPAAPETGTAPEPATATINLLAAAQAVTPAITPDTSDTVKLVDGIADGNGTFSVTLTPAITDTTKYSCKWTVLDADGNDTGVEIKATGLTWTPGAEVKDLEDGTYTVQCTVTSEDTEAYNISDTPVDFKLVIETLPEATFTADNSASVTGPTDSEPAWGITVPETGTTKITPDPLNGTWAPEELPAGVTAAEDGTLTVDPETLGEDPVTLAYTYGPAGATKTATVVIAKGEIAQLTVTPAEATIEIGETTQLTASGAPDGTEVTWSSSDESVATVSANGTVTGVAAGTATITATAGSLTASATITVAPAPTVDFTVDSENEVSGEAPDQVVTAPATITATPADGTWSGLPDGVEPAADGSVTIPDTAEPGYYELSYTANGTTGTITVYVPEKPVKADGSDVKDEIDPENPDSITTPGVTVGGNAEDNSSVIVIWVDAKSGRVVARVEVAPGSPEAKLPVSVVLNLTFNSVNPDAAARAAGDTVTQYAEVVGYVFPAAAGESGGPIANVTVGSSMPQSAINAAVNENGETDGAPIARAVYTKQVQLGNLTLTLPENMNFVSVFDPAGEIPTPGVEVQLPSVEGALSAEDEAPKWTLSIGSSEIASGEYTVKDGGVVNDDLLISLGEEAWNKASDVLEQSNMANGEYTASDFTASLVITAQGESVIISATLGGNEVTVTDAQGNSATYPCDGQWFFMTGASA